MTFKSVLQMLKPYRAQMIIIMVLAVIISCISAVTPFVNQNMIDKGLLSGDIRAVINHVILLILLQICGHGVEYFQRSQEIGITNDLGKKLKTEAFEHGLKLKPRHFKEQGFYKTIGDALFDISSILSITNNSLLTIFVIICKCIGAAAGLAILDRRLAIFIAAIIPLKIWVTAVMRKRAEKHSKQLMEDNKKYNSWFSNILSGVIDIKLWGLEKKTIEEYTEHVQTINDSTKRLSLMTAKNRLLTSGLEVTFIDALYILGGFLISGKQLTFGGLIAFITFTAYVLTPVNIIMDIRIILKQIAPNVKSLKRFYALEEENYTASLPLADKISTIEFKNVSVLIEDRSVLDNINLKIKRGEKVFITGENGSGKTTILNLLLRLCEPTEGNILVNDIPINEYNIEDYRQKFSIVTQDTHLFKGTVKDNITFSSGRDIAFDNSERLKFCTQAIENWESQYETLVGNEGTKVSGGERQKIALLRALNRKTNNEPTSNYDSESDAEFNHFINENADYDFYFIVTHRNGILSGANKVLELENGKLNIK